MIRDGASMSMWFLIHCSKKHAIQIVQNCSPYGCLLHVPGAGRLASQHLETTLILLGVVNYTNCETQAPHAAVGQLFEQFAQDW